MPTWTNIAKPTGTSYTRVNPTGGKEDYDESSLSYNDSATFYNGLNPTAYTNIAKPTGAVLLVRGMATGLIIPLTWSTQRDVGAWKQIPKPLD